MPQDLYTYSALPGPKILASPLLQALLNPRLIHFFNPKSTSFQNHVFFLEIDSSQITQISINMIKSAKNYLKMTTDPTLADAAATLISSDFKEIGDATKKLANHVVQLGVSGGFITTILQWFACFAAIYLLILDRTNWRTNMLTSLLVPYVFLTFPDWLFGILRGDVGKWITLIGVILRLFFPNHFADHLLLPGALLLLIVVSPSFVAGEVRAGLIGVIICLGIGCYLLQEHIRASGGFRNAFTKSHGISNTIGIVLLFVFPVWALITLV
ncbi:hypothetical protein QVD17_05716 [Tagetes erecta]|uniref:Uncharacterized protein n=1 Tax=Tagetes erecta TaxID=13708 RepID=A0AAD8PBQ1_TARER|nr:hypothetical protein QVD17_05716 [Tagetes erecta]